MTKQSIIFFFLFCLACGKSTQTETIEETSTLTPFEMTIGDHSNIEPSDHQKIVDAKGREITNIDIENLEEQIQKAENKIHIFHFWSLSHPTSLNMNMDLEQIKLQFDEELEVILVNIDSIHLQPAINTYLRTTGITTTSYQLQTEENWTHRINQPWNGELPYLLMVQQEHQTFLSYQQVLAYETLYAILQPLL